MARTGQLLRERQGQRSALTDGPSTFLASPRRGLHSKHPVPTLSKGNFAGTLFIYVASYSRQGCLRSREQDTTLKKEVLKLELPAAA